MLKLLSAYPDPDVSDHTHLNELNPADVFWMLKHMQKDNYMLQIILKK